MSFHFPRYRPNEKHKFLLARTLAYRWPTRRHLRGHFLCSILTIFPLRFLPWSVSIMWRLKIIGSDAICFYFVWQKTFTNEAKFYFWVGAHISVSVSVSVSLVYPPDIWRTQLLCAAQLFAGKKKKQKKRKHIFRCLFLGHGVCSNQHTHTQKKVSRLFWGFLN